MANYKYKRTNFMKVFEVNSIMEYDLLLNNWELFEINAQVKYGMITSLDIQRPDILSYRIYGDSQYWWILCKVNNIDDVWNDMYIGMTIIIPDIVDINAFYNKVKLRERDV